MAAFPGGTHSKERCNQVSLAEELQDSDAEEETAGTAGELLFSLVTDSSDTRTSPDAGINITSLTSHIIERIWTGPPSLSEPMVMPPHIQQQMSPSVFFHPEFQLLLQQAAGKNSSPQLRAVHFLQDQEWLCQKLQKLTSEPWTVP